MGIEQVKSELQENSSMCSQAALAYINAIEQIKEELDDQISLSNSEIVRSTLIHVRDDIIDKHLKNI